MQKFTFSRFNGCVGTLDCMKVVWGKCPMKLQGRFKCGTSPTTISVAAVAHADLTCAHLNMVSGANNDIQNLWQDNLYQAILSGEWGRRTFRIPGPKGGEFRIVYFVVDGIYPKLPFLVRTVKHPSSRGEKRYARNVATFRNRVERMFGIVQGRFKIVRSGVRVEYHDKKFVHDIIKFCFMVHNMIVRTANNINDQFNAEGDAMDENDIACEFEGENDDDDDSTIIGTQNVLSDDELEEWLRFEASVALDEQEHYRLRDALQAYHATLKDNY